MLSSEAATRSSAADLELTHPKYRPEIDGLRAVAVLSVVAYHAFPFRLGGGFIGVDIFFVISGYLISTIIFDNLQRDSFSFVTFYGRRVRRIFPALIIVMATCMAIGWFVLLGNEYEQLGKHVAGGAGFVSNLILWGESGYFDKAAATKPLLHLWSLGIEEQFYIVWPLLLWVCWKRNLNGLTITVVIIILSFLLNVRDAKADPVADFYSPLTRFWELLVGGLVASPTLNRSRALSFARDKVDRWLGVIVYQTAPAANDTTRRDANAILGAILIAVGLIVINDRTPYPSAWALLPTIGAALIIDAGPDAWFNRRILANRVLVWFGLISYPLYLWHWPLLSFERIVENETPSWTTRIAIVALSIALAWLTYAIVEWPIRHRSKSRIATIGVLLAMIAVGALGYVAYAAGGFMSRPIARNAAVLSNYDYLKGVSVLDYWRGSCFNIIDDTFESYANNGCEREQFPSHKKVFLIGDSHSAYLGLALKKYLAAREDNLFQFSAGFCTPFALNEVRDRCRDINRHVVEQIGKQRPETVILFAHYLAYPDRPHLFGEKVPFEDLVLRATQTFADLGVKKVVVLGQIPAWEDDLPKVLIRRFLLKRKSIPERTYAGVVSRSLDMDRRLRELKFPPNVTYLSLKDLLCNDTGCLTKVGPDLETDLVVLDYGHLTEAGADFIGRNLLYQHLQ